MLDNLTIEREVELRREAERVCDDHPQTPDDHAHVPDSAPTNTAIHGGVFKIYVGLFVAILAAFYLTFNHDSETVFIIGICAFYGLMYFGTPIVLQRVSKETRKDKEWTDFLDQPFATNTGPISGRTALLQICIVPAALAVCVSGICITIALVP